MSVPGYRNTAPVKLYMELSRESLVGLEEGVFTGIQDPFELKDCLVSFSYSLTQSNTAGVFEVTLINPSQSVEEKVFSWYCAVKPRSWKPSEVATPEEWTFSAGQTATVFLRWGYQNETTERDAEKRSAFSHIHKTQLYDIDFTISDKKERMIKLRLLNNHDIGILRQKDRNAKQERTTHRVKLNNDSGIRTPSEIISEMLGTLAGGDGVQPFVFLNDEHKQRLNDEFDKIHPGANKQTPSSEEQATTPPKDRINPRSPKSKQITFDIAKQYYEYLDMGVVVDLDTPPETAAPTVSVAKPSVYQNGVAGGQTDAQAVERNKEAAVAASEETFVFTGTVGGMLDANQDNPLEAYFPGLSNQPIPVDKFILVNTNKPGTSYSFTLDDLRAVRNNDEIALIPLPPVQQKKLLSLFDAASETDKLKYLAVREYDSTEGYALNKYKLSEYTNAATEIDVFIEQLEANHQEIIQEEAPQDTDQEIAEDQQVIDDNTSDEEPKPQEPPVDRSFVSVVCSNKYDYLNSFINGLNETFFDTAGEYIAIRYMQTSVVPTESRSEVEAVIGKVNWDEADTLCMIGSLSKIQDALDFNRRIDSFEIQVDGSPDVVSLATGFNQRKDNIIVNLEHRVSKASFYNTVLNSPIVAQKLYSVIERFESSEYRDVVNQVLGLALVEQGGAIAQVFYENGVPISKQVKKNDVSIASDAFPAELAEKSISQVSRIVNSLDEEVVDSAVGGEARETIKKQIEEDLTFIKNNDFMNIFFPYISGSELDKMQVKMYVDGQEITKDSRFRYITSTPLSLLQKKLDTNSPEEAIVLASKLRTLFAFKKNISNIRIKTLGVPEMDILAYETGVRKCAIWISEPRVPGTFHWLTGIYQIVDVSHDLSVGGGYTSEFTLIPTAGDTADEMLKYGYTFLTNA